MPRQERTLLREARRYLVQYLGAAISRRNVHSRLRSGNLLVASVLLLGLFVLSSAEISSYILIRGNIIFFGDIPNRLSPYLLFEPPCITLYMILNVVIGPFWLRHPNRGDLQVLPVNMYWLFLQFAVVPVVLFAGLRILSSLADQTWIHVFAVHSKQAEDVGAYFIGALFVSIDSVLKGYVASAIAFLGCVYIRSPWKRICLFLALAYVIVYWQYFGQNWMWRFSISLWPPARYVTLRLPMLLAGISISYVIIKLPMTLPWQRPASCFEKM